MSTKAELLTVRTGPSQAEVEQGLELLPPFAVEGGVGDPAGWLEW